jgi:serine protease AprX
MAKIIAFFMHETEMGLAQQKMKNAVLTDSYLLGEIDDIEIDNLRKGGLIVQVLGDEEEAETPGKPPAGFRLAVPHMERPREPKEIAGPSVDIAKPNYYIIRLKGPLLEEWRDGLKKIGIQLLEYVKKNSYTAKILPNQLQGIQSLPFVSSLRLYGAGDTGPIVLKRTITKRPSVPMPSMPEKKILTYDLRLHQEEDLTLVKDWLKNKNVNIAGASGRKIRFYLLENSPLADEVARLPEVASIEEYIPPKLHNNMARVLLAIDQAVAPNPLRNLSQTGDGQIIAIADTGLDDKHPDFQDRIIGLVSLGRNGDSSDPHGHGTHVAGSVLGDGTASGGVLRGSAPGARLFFQSILDSQGGLGGLPLNLEDLFEEAYQAGARIHNNSWGSATGSEYTFNSIEVDEFVSKRRDMLIVVSAGNEGQAAIRSHSQPGFVDFLSIGSPASCKNALTVGASRSSRVDGPFSNLTYGYIFPSEFPDPPISVENISGNPEALAAFSSRGPCLDRHIKPDVVAPGTEIASTKSSRAPIRNYWGPYPNNAYYAYMGGTSMAAPLVSGCAALVREFFVKDKNHDPSAALLKATIINGTRWLVAPDSIADYPLPPNFHQGFGCVYMPWTIPNSTEPSLKLHFQDSWKDPSKQFCRSGQRFRYQFSISGGRPLRICLAWTDLPARGLQNNLNLFLQHIQSGVKWIGNENLPMSLAGPDSDNNVEILRLDTPQAGDYLIQITATNLLQGLQDFALVVSGDLSTSLMPY